MGPEAIAGEVLPSPAALDRLFTGEPTRDVLGFVLRGLAPGRTAVVASFGAETAVLLHLVAAIAPQTPVLFLDTGQHFPETLAYRDALVERLGLTDVRSIAPEPGRLAALDPGGDLHGRDPDLCCRIRKVQPLDRALTGFDVWVTGRKRYQGGLRAALPLFEADGARLKVNPLAGWRPQDIRRHLREHDLPAHPLTRAGYGSIGCAPCTTPLRAGEEERAGRWRGSTKTECGIHLSRNGRLVRVIGSDAA